jgi:hypothetical protein
MNEPTADLLGIIGDPATWPVVTSSGSPLVNILIRPGVYVRMREADARAQGLLPEEKAAPPAPNKARPRAANKKRSE